jgi:serine/threonine-protein kinase HipA
MGSAADAHGLKLNISEADNTMDLELAFAVAPYFRVPDAMAAEIVERQRRMVSQWRKIAEPLGIAARQQERMAGAFRLAA